MPRGRPRTGRAEALIVKSGELIGWALGGVEREIADTRERLSTLMVHASKLRSRLASVQGGKASRASSAGARPRGRRRMSVAARKRISEMMKKRWAERKRRQRG